MESEITGDIIYQETKHLAFTRQDINAIPLMVDIRSKKDGSWVGRIMWYGPYKQYCEFRGPDTVFDSERNDEVNEYLKLLNHEHNKRNKEEKK